ncbi:MAG: hypothetical protein LIO65_08155 [Odoribacter sp.]|nr:hypothetical protein [Odoribacter sp.]
MKEYKDRTYRNYFSEERWESFVVCYKEMDIWVGIDKASYQEEMPNFCHKLIKELRDEMDKYILTDLAYASALVSYNAKEDAPEILKNVSYQLYYGY